MGWSSWTGKPWEEVKKKRAVGLVGLDVTVGISVPVPVHTR
jgi:hypothetical protein